MLLRSSTILVGYPSVGHIPFHGFHEVGNEVEALYGIDIECIVDLVFCGWSAKVVQTDNDQDDNDDNNQWDQIHGLVVLVVQM